MLRAASTRETAPSVTGIIGASVRSFFCLPSVLSRDDSLV